MTYSELQYVIIEGNDFRKINLNEALIYLVNSEWIFWSNWKKKY